ncbi:hypothetical protein D5R40_30150 [Okeania hirsuta]|uniref:Uncharacterized protein n=1 Tax=Okeania hirsuta TaxID=1458930 RepID=A0A3N6PEP8_9CYAN|nr:hypothetical protein [Okeania hirsuta]RQH24110.1 hypothetical protein D5R40_30150 [Okeania hirsuta]
MITKIESIEKEVISNKQLLENLEDKKETYKRESISRKNIIELEEKTRRWQEGIYYLKRRKRKRVSY